MAGLFEDPDVLVEDGAAGELGNIGASLVVPDKLARILAFSRTGRAYSQGVDSSVG